MSTEQILELFRSHLIAIGMGILDFTDLDIKNHHGLVKFYEDCECDGIKER